MLSLSSYCSRIFGWLYFQKQPKWGSQVKYVISQVAKMFASLSTLVAANTTIINFHYEMEEYPMPMPMPNYTKAEEAEGHY
jgi:hypothetical protein